MSHFTTALVSDGNSSPSYVLKSRTCGGREGERKREHVCFSETRMMVTAQFNDLREHIYINSILQTEPTAAGIRKDLRPRRKASLNK